MITIYIKNPIYFKGMLIIHLYRKLHFSSFNSPLDNTVKVKAILKFLTASSFVFQTKKNIKTKYFNVSTMLQDYILSDAHVVSTS
jgi:hypothetical protein